jgi:hypothetical protein
MPERPAVLAAQLSIVGRGASRNAVDEEFLMMMETTPANYRGVATGLSALPILALRNLSGTEQLVQISCLFEDRLQAFLSIWRKLLPA